MVNQNELKDPSTDSKEKCNFFPQVALFLDGELKDASEHCFLQHLESCEECQHSLAIEQELAHSFVMEMVPEEPQQSLSARFEESLLQGELLHGQPSGQCSSDTTRTSVGHATAARPAEMASGEVVSAFWSSPWLSSAAAVLLMLGLAFFVTKTNPLNENSGQLAKNNGAKLSDENGSGDNKNDLDNQLDPNSSGASNSSLEDVNAKPEEKVDMAAKLQSENNAAKSESTDLDPSAVESSAKTSVATNSVPDASESEEVLSTIEVVPGDVNLDGLLDAGDMSLVMNSLRDGDLKPMTCPAAADIDGDHLLTPNDVLMMTTRINQSVQSLEAFIQVPVEEHLGCNASVCP